jgi:hypothetical protein
VNPLGVFQTLLQIRGASWAARRIMGGSAPMRSMIALLISCSDARKKLAAWCRAQGAELIGFCRHLGKEIGGFVQHLGFQHNVTNTRRFRSIATSSDACVLFRLRP